VSVVTPTPTRPPGAPSGRAPGATPVATPISQPDPEVLDAVRWSADGLVPAIVQERATGEVLMLAWMDEEALRRTLASGRTWFWSRSRGEHWCKGETSGDRQWVRDVRLDCDGDTVLVRVEQEGAGACHTGARTCFSRSFGRSAPAGAEAATPAAAADAGVAPAPPAP
jgi:phosphoribosyl-AMP cyclohydrolase